MDYKSTLKLVNQKIYQVLCEGSVSPEKTQIRDLTYSNLRRGWDSRFYATDIDWLEYYDYEPVAILESKLRIGKRADINCIQFKVLATLADRAKLPFFILRYDRSGYYFDITPRNKLAKKFLEEHYNIGKDISFNGYEDEQRLTQEEFIVFHCFLRGLDVDTIKIKSKRWISLAQLNKVKKNDC